MDNKVKRRCLLPAIPEQELAAKLLDAAVDAIFLSDFDLAAELIQAADMQKLRERNILLVSTLKPEIHRQTTRPRDLLKKDQRDPVRMPATSLQRTVFAEDGWRCRFCGTKVICREARKKLVQLFPNVVTWGGPEYQQHAALYGMAVSLDHVLPHSRGGKNERSNFVTACYTCQVGRGEWTLDESELLDPRDHPPVLDAWDGLSRIRSYRPPTSGEAP